MVDVSHFLAPPVVGSPTVDGVTAVSMNGQLYLAQVTRDSNHVSSYRAGGHALINHTQRVANSLFVSGHGPTRFPGQWGQPQGGWVQFIPVTDANLVREITTYLGRNGMTPYERTNAMSRPSADFFEGHAISSVLPVIPADALRNMGQSRETPVSFPPPATSVAATTPSRPTALMTPEERSLAALTPARPGSFPIATTGNAPSMRQPASAAASTATSTPAAPRTPSNQPLPAVIPAPQPPHDSRSILSGAVPPVAPRSPVFPAVTPRRLTGNETYTVVHFGGDYYFAPANLQRPSGSEINNFLSVGNIHVRTYRDRNEVQPYITNNPLDPPDSFITARDNGRLLHLTPIPRNMVSEVVNGLTETGFAPLHFDGERLSRRTLPGFAVPQDMANAVLAGNAAPLTNALRSGPSASASWRNLPSTFAQPPVTPGRQPGGQTTPVSFSQPPAPVDYNTSPTPSPARTTTPTPTTPPAQTPSAGRLLMGAGIGAALFGLGGAAMLGTGLTSFLMAMAGLVGGLAISYFTGGGSLGTAQPRPQATPAANNQNRNQGTGQNLAPQTGTPGLDVRVPTGLPTPPPGSRPQPQVGGH